MALAAIRPQGLSQGDLIQLLYETIAAIISVSSAPTTTWTVTVQDWKGSRTGSAVGDKVISPNGWNQAYFVQALYETIVYGIASLSGFGEGDFTGKIANLAHTLTGGTTTRTYWLMPHGISQGDLAECLYEIMEALDDVTGYSASNFTLYAENKAGSVAAFS